VSHELLLLGHVTVVDMVIVADKEVELATGLMLPLQVKQTSQLQSQTPHTGVPSVVVEQHAPTVQLNHCHENDRGNTNTINTNTTLVANNSHLGLVKAVVTGATAANEPPPNAANVAMVTVSVVLPAGVVLV
jgi:hypothetical protein